MGAAEDEQGLDPEDWDEVRAVGHALVDELPQDGASALLCVERDPEACHRSIIAAALASNYDVAVTHLLP